MRKKQELQWSFWKNLDFKYTATNSYGAIVTDYALYSDYQIVQGEMGSSLAHSYYISSASEEINWNDIEDYLKSIN